MKRLKIWIFCGCCMFVMWNINCDNSGATNGSALNNEDIEWLEQAGMKLFKGSTPPNIEGSYSLNSLTIAHDDLGLDHFIHDYTYSFNQQNGLDILLSYAGPQAGDSAWDMPVNIYGTGNCFSVVAYVEATSNGCHYTMSQVISGCLAEKGVTDWQLGIVMGKKSGENCDDMLNENHRRVIEEEDGLAARVK